MKHPIATNSHFVRTPILYIEIYQEAKKLNKVRIKSMLEIEKET